ncbi:iron complex transport system substrate-binding protein [Lutibacter sp. Hel_I_33_5]|uniref:ABC transporter substrate-binding protein n=1 Tax=Lutibacter sp. Hel_I_33_5 TaxID=1566289 RepID=UPI0011A6C0BB|nr:ABC transporter substrate-binding protein [Lutibacter sp. Hel_I_33_5]TVZ55067.1 iron complex transport system substrate-binding protein [Lutibacter sp. Hel_I_33_5]
MYKSVFTSIFCFFFLLQFTACKEIKKETNYNSKIKSLLNINYAKGFDFKKDTLFIKTPYKNSNEDFIYRIQYKKDDGNLSDKNTTTLLVPIEKMVATSTTHLPMIELLNEENSLIGFPHTKYVSSEKTRALIDSGKITELGKESSLNTEVLLDLNPELVVGYSVNSINKVFQTIEKAGIPVIQNGDWLEETPLGRAEWIKFFGVLFDKSKEADSIFKSIEKSYLEAKEIALKAKNKPTVLSGAIMSKDIWNLPAGESFVATFLNDANLNYLWKDTKGKGSLSLSYESVLEKAQDADFWIAPGYFSSKEQMLASNKQYKNFKSFKEDNIYTPSTKKGKTGGVIYYELASTRPDLVLKDIIKITNPELLPTYTLTFFEKME